MIWKLITLLHRSRRHETNVTGINWNEIKMNKLRLFNDRWRTRKYLIFNLGSSSPTERIEQQWPQEAAVACRGGSRGWGPLGPEPGSKHARPHPHGTGRRRPSCSLTSRGAGRGSVGPQWGPKRHRWIPPTTAHRARVAAEDERRPWLLLAREKKDETTNS